MKKHIKAGKVVLDIVSVVLALIYIGPIVWAFFVSLQHEGKKISSVISWFTPAYTLKNYKDVIFNSSVPLWFINSLLIAVLVTAATIIVTAMAAYALALLPFK